MAKLCTGQTIITYVEDDEKIMAYCQQHGMPEYDCGYYEDSNTDEEQEWVYADTTAWYVTSAMMEKHHTGHMRTRSDRKFQIEMGQLV